jgi:hypothetical protein
MRIFDNYLGACGWVHGGLPGVGSVEVWATLTACAPLPNQRDANELWSGTKVIGTHPQVHNQPLVV